MPGKFFVIESVFYILSLTILKHAEFFFFLRGKFFINPFGLSILIFMLVVGNMDRLVLEDECSLGMGVFLYIM